MACCVVSAYAIYLIIRTHNRLRSTLTLSSLRSSGEPDPKALDDASLAASSDSLAMAVLRVTDMSCNACATAISDALEHSPGILHANLLLPVAQVRVAYDRHLYDVPSIGAVIDQLGHGWQEVGAEESWAAAYKRRSQEQLRTMALTRKRLWEASAAAGVVLLLAMLPRPLQTAWSIPTQAALCSFIIFVCCRNLHRQAWRAAAFSRVDMSTLSSIALLISLSRSLVWAWLGQEAHFYPVATLATILIGGDLIKQTVSCRSWAPFTSITNQMPTSVEIQATSTSDRDPSRDVTSRIPTKLLRIGDLVNLPELTLAPADGIAMTDGYVVDTFATGELNPRKKIAGDVIYAGSVARHGSIRMQVQRVGASTMLEQLLGAVTVADSLKSSQVDFWERCLRFYCSAVLMLSLLIGGWRYFMLKHLLTNAFEGSVAVLLSSCPCALTLMIPSCVALFIGHAFSQSQVLVCGGKRIVQAAPSVKVVLLDKTGTLTEPQISVCSTTVHSSWRNILQDKQCIWEVVSSLESRSTHPVGIALKKYADQETLGLPTKLLSPSVTDVEELEGLGVVGWLQVSDRRIHVAIGSWRLTQRLLAEAGSPCLRSCADFEHSKQVFIVLDCYVVATMSLREVLRHDAKETVQDLKNSGYAVGVISGDSPTAVAAIAQEVNIPLQWCWSEQLPNEKATVVAEIQRLYGAVIMVGDQLNDAPAISTAAIGCCLSDEQGFPEATVADIIMHQDSSCRVKGLARIPYLLRLCRVAQRRIRIGLIWAIFYNIGMLCAASGASEWLCGLSLPPAYVSFAMSMSSTVTMVNMACLKLDLDRVQR